MHNAALGEMSWMDWGNNGVRESGEGMREKKKKSPGADSHIFPGVPCCLL